LVISALVLYQCFALALRTTYLYPQQTYNLFGEVAWITPWFDSFINLLFVLRFFFIYQGGKRGRCGLLFWFILVWCSACKGKKVSRKNQMCYLYVGSFFVCRTNASHTHRYLPTLAIKIWHKIPDMPIPSEIKPSSIW